MSEVYARRWEQADTTDRLLREITKQRSPSLRKLRLFAVACCRHYWDTLDVPEARELLECVEVQVDGGCKWRSVQAKRAACQSALVGISRPEELAGNTGGISRFSLATAALFASESDRHRVVQVTWHTTSRTRAGAFTDPVQIALIRDIFGNPFRPVTFDPDWRTATAVGLAREMYEAREFDRLPVLADALEEAGCDVAELLTHCRNPQQAHVRGCWVVDLVLGKQ